jgi:hypothetical protein
VKEFGISVLAIRDLGPRSAGLVTIAAVPTVAQRGTRLDRVHEVTHMPGPLELVKAGLGVAVRWAWALAPRRAGRCACSAGREVLPRAGRSRS